MIRLFTVFVLLAVFSAAAIPAAAQGTGTSVYIRTVAPDGTAITDACYTFLDGASLEGCDENGDGYIRFQGIPAGTYTVSTTRPSAGKMPVGDFPVTIQAVSTDQVFDVVAAPGPATPGTTTIAIRAEDPATGSALPGSCMILHGGSIEGCDENGDGQIDFEGMPLGSYLLQETVAPVGAMPLPAQWVVIDRGGMYVINRPFTGAIADGVTANVALVTRDPASGDLLPGACYIIENASLEGCDENGDGQVDFQDVAVGTFTVRQTVAPAGHQLANPFRILIATLDPDQSIVVKQALQQHDANHRHVSVILYDSENGQRVRGGTCLELSGASLVGCDENADGQIDFLDVDVGTHQIAFTGMPQGYEPVFVSNTVYIDPNDPYTVTVVYIPLMRAP